MCVKNIVRNRVNVFLVLCVCACVRVCMQA